jgi:hypothetical protein
VERDAGDLLRAQYSAPVTAPRRKLGKVYGGPC